MCTTKTEWYFIVNPRAGSGKTMSEWVPAERMLGQKGIPFVTAMTDHSKHAIELAREAAAAGYRRIAAVGGDGSLHEVLGGICGWCAATGVPTEEFYLAVVPIGSGNDWIKSFGLPKDVMKMIDILAKGTFVQEDVVRVSLAGGKVSYMANIGGIGFDSHVCEQVNAQKERGKRSSRIYLSSLLYNFAHAKPFNAVFYRDDEQIYSGSILDIAFGNGSYCGGGMQQCNLANPSDGILDAIILPNIPIGQILTQVPRLLTGTLDKSDKIIYVRGRNFKVVPLDADSADIVELDGEIVGNLPVEIEILPGKKINVLCNPDNLK